MAAFDRGNFTINHTSYIPAKAKNLHKIKDGLEAVEAKKRNYE